MEHRVGRYIESKNMLDKHEKQLVALSGGADSVCLLLVLVALGYKVEAVHCNFHLRGEESDRDESFCISLCEERGIPLHIVHFDTESYAELHKVSIEMAARELRYKYFQQLREDINAERICVAHHREDNAETVLMNIVRGTGLAGLVGIRPINGNVVRPLLCVSRDEIEDYLRGVGQGYVTDSTNLVDDVVRNKMRLDVIPLLKEINPAVISNIVRMTEWITDVEKITDSAVDAEVSQVFDGEYIDIQALKQCVSPEYVLFRILHPLLFTTEQIQELSRFESLQVGKMWTSTSHTVVVEREKLAVISNAKLSSASISMKLPECGKYVLSPDHSIKLETLRRSPDFVVSKLPLVVTVDADKVSFPLMVRNVKSGDRMHPFGMKGSKLVSDMLNEWKAGFAERKSQLVVCDSNDNIIWLVGKRVSSHVAVTSQTQNILRVTFE